MKENLFTIQNQRISAVVSARGAELQSIKNAAGTEYLWQGDEKYWGDRAINIFPYVARLTKGEYVYRDRIYHMKIHGFLREKELSVEKILSDELILGIEDDAQTWEQYPFHFHYHIGYKLVGNELCVSIHVENKGDDYMYFGAGGHPGFQVPLGHHGEFEDYYLQFEKGIKPVRIGFSEQKFPDGTSASFRLGAGDRLPLRHQLFDQDAIVLRNAGDSVSLQADGRTEKITLVFPDIPYLGIWSTPHTDAPFVCLEPWTSLPSRQGVVEDLEEKDDLISLPPGDSCFLRWNICID